MKPVTDGQSTDNEAVMAQISGLAGEAERNRILLAKARLETQRLDALARKVVALDERFEDVAGQVFMLDALLAEALPWLSNFDKVPTVIALIAKIKTAIGSTARLPGFSTSGVKPGDLLHDRDGNVQGVAEGWPGATLDAGTEDDDVPEGEDDIDWSRRGLIGGES